VTNAFTFTFENVSNAEESQPDQEWRDATSSSPSGLPPDWGAVIAVGEFGFAFDQPMFNALGIGGYFINLATRTHEKTVHAAEGSAPAPAAGVSPLRFVAAATQAPDSPVAAGVKTSAQAASPSGLTIVPSWDASVLDSPDKSEFESAVDTAIAKIEALVTTTETISIDFGYGIMPFDGSSAGVGGGESIGNSSAYTWTQVYDAAEAIESSASASHVQKAAAALLTVDNTKYSTLLNSDLIDVTRAEALALGLPTNPLTTGPNGYDGWVALGSGPFDWAQNDPNDEDAVSALEHEISEVMGRTDDLGVANGNAAEYTLLDLFHYASSPATTYGGAGPGSAAGALDEPFVSGYNRADVSYFSYNGSTITWQYDTPNEVGANGEDVADWSTSDSDRPAATDSFDGAGGNGIDPPLSVPDLEEMSVLGYTIAPGPPVTFSAPVFGLAGALTISGMAIDSAGLQSVEIFNGATDLGAATVNATTGVWSLQVAPAAGQCNLSVVATDEVSKQSSVLAPYAIIDGGVIAADAIAAIASGGALYVVDGASVTTAGALANSGVIDVVGDGDGSPATTLDVNGALSGSGSVDISNEGELQLGNFANSGSITFGGGGGEVVQAGGATLGAAVSGFLSGDTIDFSGVAYKASYEVVWKPAKGVLKVIDAGNADAVVATVTVSGPITGDLAMASKDAGTGTDITLAQYSFFSVAPGDVVYSDVSGQSYMAYEELYVGGVYAGVDEFFNGGSSQAFSSFAYDYSAGGSLIGVSYIYPGSNGGSYASEEIDTDGGGNLTRAAFFGVSGAPFASYEYDYVGGVFAGSKFTYDPSGQPYLSYEVDYSASNAFAGEKFFYSGEEVDYDASLQLSRVLLKDVTGQPYTSLEYDYTAGVYSGYKATYTGFTTQNFTGEEVDVSAAGALEKVIYTGMSASYSSLEVDYSAGAAVDEIYDVTNVPGASAYAYQVEENPSGTVVLQTAYDLNNGGHAIVAGAAGQTLVSQGDDRMTGSATGATSFVFNGIYGADTITNFTSADHVSMPSSEFTSLSEMLGAKYAKATSNNGVLITASDGDSLMFENTTVAALSKLTANFGFA
jgi:hypothetical protein